MIRGQRKWQAKKKAQGLCIRCGNEPLVSANYCAKCLAKVREYERNKKGCQPWEAGKRGRPPITRS